MDFINAYTYGFCEKQGFTRGNVLEPSAGIGNFFGLLPVSMNSAKLNS